MRARGLAVATLSCSLCFGVACGGRSAYGQSGAAGTSGSSTGGVGAAGDAGSLPTSGRAGDSAAGSAGAFGGGAGAGAAGAPVTPPSCDGLAATCGPQQSADCCASSVVVGGTFYRAYDGVSPAYESKDSPATISDFRLDTYEVSVGRFRKFMAAYAPASIADGAGKNPNDRDDTGFSASDRASLPPDAAALEKAITGCGAFNTWSHAPGDAAFESLPIDCLDWYEAEAFCAWDGGRLPTDAEWNYAASGGAEQRVYPWGSAAPGANAELAIYDCYYGPSDCMSASNIAPVGSVPAGDGKWGHSDLAGNVWEWVEDYFVSPLPTPCVDCADHAVASAGRVVHGGGFDYDGATPLQSADRLYADPASALYNAGVRCARAP